MLETPILSPVKLTDIIRVHNDRINEVLKKRCRVTTSWLVIEMNIIIGLLESIKENTLILSSSVISRIDTKRGSLSREEYIQQLVEKNCSKCPYNPWHDEDEEERRINESE